MRFSLPTYFTLLLALSGLACTVTGFAEKNQSALFLGLTLKMFATAAFVACRWRDQRELSDTHE